MKMNKKLSDIYRKDVIKDSEFLRQLIYEYDSYQVNPLLSYFTTEDIAEIYRLAISPAYNGEIHEKYRLLGEIMNRRGFKLIGGGTNRRAYECIYDDRVVAKVATDRVGLTSNLKEFVNQNVLKPFCNKIFSVSPDGALSIMEKVVPIKDVSEFQKYAPEIHEILFFRFRNHDLAMDDIGTRSMKNWGYRQGFGPVLLDYPSMYVANPKKRLCPNIVDGKMCCGTLDYDDGYNRIVCTECGRTFEASTLSMPKGDELSNLLSAVGYKKDKEKGVKKMKIQITDIETGRTEVRNCDARSKHIDYTVSNMNNNVEYRQKPSTPMRKKKRRVIITSLNPEEEVVTTPTQTTAVVEEPKPEKKEEPKVKEVVTSKLVEMFNMLNSGINFTVLNEKKDAMTLMKLAKEINEMTTENHFVEVKEAARIYKDMCTATMLTDKNGEVSFNNIIECDCVLNQLLSEISDDNPNRFIVFYKLINNVKNTKSFCNSIINFWKTVITKLSFDIMDEEEDHTDIHIYKTVYDKYLEIVSNALHDYKFNIVISGGSKYSVSNVLSFITRGLNELEELSLNKDAIDMTKDLTISFLDSSITFTNHCVNEVKEESKEPVVVSSEPVSTVVPENLGDNGKRMSRSQEQRYGGKKKKNRNRNHRR